MRILNSEFQHSLYHLSYGFRHPQAIYNVSYSTVLEKFSKIVSVLEKVSLERPFVDPKNIKWDSELLECQKNLLYAIMEHFDDCENILACFFPRDANRSKNPHVKAFLKATKEYRDHIGSIANHIKHEQGRLRSLVLFNDELSLPGYFVENAVGENAIGPVEKIHKGGNTAFSFSRDLRYNLFHLYTIAKHLGDAITDIVDAQVSPKVVEQIVKPNFTLIEVASGISGLPRNFYPDEMKKPVPSVIVSSENDFSSKLVSMTYPDNDYQISTLPEKMKIAVAYRGDGVTKTFKLPYRQEK